MKVVYQTIDGKVFEEPFAAEVWESRLEKISRIENFIISEGFSTFSAFDVAELIVDNSSWVIEVLTPLESDR